MEDRYFQKTKEACFVLFIGYDIRLLTPWQSGSRPKYNKTKIQTLLHLCYSSQNKANLVEGEFRDWGSLKNNIKTIEGLLSDSKMFRPQWQHYRRHTYQLYTLKLWNLVCARFHQNLCPLRRRPGPFTCYWIGCVAHTLSGDDFSKQEKNELIYFNH